MSITAEFIADTNRTSVLRNDQDSAVATVPVIPIPPSCSQWREHLSRLLSRASRGDTSAFMQFYDHTSAVVYRVAGSRCVDPVAAEAAAQNVYLRAWERASTYAGSGLSPLAWLLADAAPAPAPAAC